MTRVLEMINIILQSLKMPPVQDPKQAQGLAQHAAQIKEMLPPIIVSILPDESYHLGDGNHRLGIARIVGIPTLKAFILQS